MSFFAGGFMVLLLENIGCWVTGYFGYELRAGYTDCLELHELHGFLGLAAGYFSCGLIWLRVKGYELRVVFVTGYALASCQLSSIPRLRPTTHAIIIRVISEINNNPW
jgi:hypothetical protein